MKKLFNAIRKNDIDSVKKIIESTPDIISCVSVGAPKKDEGQSPLQVALKASSTEIVNYLLDVGADVNFMESKGHWRAPVIHDAINRAIMCSRWNVNRCGELEVFSTKKDADEAFEILKKIISLGADINAKDSVGNTPLNSPLSRACLQARQILPRTNSDDDRVLTDELASDISRIFKLIIDSGADVNYVHPNTGKTCAEDYANETLEIFLR